MAIDPKIHRSDVFPAICLVGGGQMGRAMVGGMFSQDLLAESAVTVVDPSTESQAWWESNHPQTTRIADLSDGKIPDVVILAVKPNVISKVASQTAGFWEGKLVISIAAGIDLTRLGGWIGHRRVVRVMPNTPCLVGQGASAFCVGATVEDQDRLLVESMLGAVGVCAQVTEAQIDAVTGLSGSGPAYVFTIIEALADGGVLAGLPRDLAMTLATQTVLGAATMVQQTGRHPGQLKDAVASPGGTTIAGLAVLEQNALRGTLIRAVQVAAQKSRDLGAS